MEHGLVELADLLMRRVVGRGSSGIAVVVVIGVAIACRLHVGRLGGRGATHGGDRRFASNCFSKSRMAAS